MNKLTLAFKTFRQLGWTASFKFAVYQTLLRSGIYRLTMPARKTRHDVSHLIKQFPPFKERSTDTKKLTNSNLSELLSEADEICKGKIRLFGGEPVSLDLIPVINPKHWSYYHSNQLGGKDIKLIWEPGRFGWAMTLARAYSYTGDEKYADIFWQYTMEFKSANPINAGPHWSSAQEVALRLIALTFVYILLEETATLEQKQAVAEMLAEHASRIPPTLIYAQAQRNNHLLTEAAALYTAGCILSDHPNSSEWRSLGWKHFNEGIEDQIEADGTYTQHSTNYHRLMLHTALWMQSLASWQNEEMPDNTLGKLEMAYRWLLAITDPETGQAPNLGANDGANILPLSVSKYSDFRPVLQAAGIAFAKETPFTKGPWDELHAWLFSPTATEPTLIEDKESWASLRCVKFSGRPSHSDQLHVDLWWRGLNIAQDAGTYSYNSNPPWDNSLKGADVHNTVSLNGADHMQSAGKFRWVDVAHGNILEFRDGFIKATHNGYKKSGVEHIRKLNKKSDQIWTITDLIQPFAQTPSKKIETRCHWLLPDWEMEIKDGVVRLRSPHGWIEVKFESEQEYKLDIAKAGKQMVGEGNCPPYRGWVSKTYMHKEPAISLAFTIKAVPPFNFKTIFQFPK